LFGIENISPGERRLIMSRPPTLISTLLAARCTSPVLFLCPQAAKQEYDQVILMFTDPSFSKTIFFNAELQNVLSFLRKRIHRPTAARNFQME
jgi:hypothetical protein